MSLTAKLRLELSHLILTTTHEEDKMIIYIFHMRRLRSAKMTHP
jgi:hypothetical protein